MRTLPYFNDNGDLPPGVYAASMDEVTTRFGHGSFQRVLLAERLQRIYSLAKDTGHLVRFILFGSFVTDRTAPNDIDIFLLMENSFDVTQLKGETLILFDHRAAQNYFGASIFWLRRLAAFGGEEDAVRHWQIKRDGAFRGIVEVV